MITDIDPYTWYSNRELNFTPKHFTVASTPITLESRIWILDSLRGRFSIISKYQEHDPGPGSLDIFFDDFSGVPAFEDPKEATIYELKWS